MYERNVQARVMTSLRHIANYVTLPYLSSMVESCTHPHALSVFYRDIYRMREGAAALTIQSWEEWQKLPFVTKKDLTEAPLQKRSFIPFSKVDSLMASSGTSGGAPMFTARAQLRGVIHSGPYAQYASSVGGWLLAFPSPAHSTISMSGYKVRVVTFDPLEPAASIRLIRTAGVENIMTSPGTLPKVAALLREERMHLNIRFINIVGGFCTRSLHTFIRETFPGAAVVVDYGSSEVGHFAISQPDNTRTQDVFETLPGSFAELIDSDTRVPLEPAKDTEGDIVLTVYPGEPFAFPMIRYRVGDRVRVVERWGSGPTDWSFEVLGRSDTDFVKIEGGMLRADEVERVLLEMNERVEDTFSLHVSEEAGSGTLRTKAVLYVRTKRSLSMEHLAEDIARMLQVGPATTYADGTMRGYYLPLECKELPRESGTQKHKRIIRE